MNTRAYVLYDLDAASSAPSGLTKSALLSVGAKRVSVAGQILGWRVGEFEVDPGKHIHGVRIRYQDGLLLTRRTQYVEVPRNARNVQLVMGDELPGRYERALDAAP